MLSLEKTQIIHSNYFISKLITKINFNLINFNSKVISNFQNFIDFSIFINLEINFYTVFIKLMQLIYLKNNLL